MKSSRAASCRPSTCPPTAGKPSASSAITLEKPATGNARLWVVNPDNDSVTAFDAVTRAKLGEVATGAAPRSVAVAQDGQIWVVNKRADTVTVINPANRAVARTLNLPRAARSPSASRWSPSGPMAYVALEGTGTLLALHTATFATVGSVAVGPNPRHVSVSADGSKILVSRFISPLLPGEGGGRGHAHAVHGRRGGAAERGHVERGPHDGAARERCAGTAKPADAACPITWAPR